MALSSQAELIRDLVLYFLKQGTYSGQGDIAVLCAYLGQLQKVRAVLSDAKLAVSVDERDQEQLELQGADPEPEAFENVSVTRHVSASILARQDESLNAFFMSVDSPGHCRYVPRRGSQNRHCVSRSQFRELFDGCSYWILKGMLKESVILPKFSNIILVEELKSNQRCAISSTTRIIRAWECGQSASKRYLEQGSCRNGSSRSNRKRIQCCLRQTSRRLSPCQWPQAAAFVST